MNKNKLNGFTLVELMVGMVLGLIVISGISYIYVSVVVSSSAALKSSKLNTQLSMVMSIISEDIRRASYWANPSVLPASQNPFNVNDDTLLTVFSTSTQKVVEDSGTNGYCILYSYDADKDGNVDIASGSSEYFGFKYDISKYAILMAVNNGENKATSCTASSWELLTDDSLIKITSFNLNLSASACVNSSEPDLVDNDNDDETDESDEKDCYDVAPSTDHVTVETREIMIEIEGELLNDPSIKSKIQQSVRVRNDLVRIR